MTNNETGSVQDAGLPTYPSAMYLCVQLQKLKMHVKINVKRHLWEDLAQAAINPSGSSTVIRKYDLQISNYK